MRKILMLAGGLALLAAPAFATTPQAYRGGLSPGMQQAQVPTQERDCYQSSSDRIRKYSPDPSAHAPSQASSCQAGQRIRKYDPNP